jgi:hypothetical protein
VSTRYTRDLLPGDRFRSVTGKVRTVLTNSPPKPGGTTHLLTMEEGTWLMSQADTSWELLPPDPAAIWDQGYAAALHDASESIPQENPYRV